MLHQPTLEKLEALRLHGMAQAWRELAQSEQAGDLSFEERMALLVDRQFTWRQNEAFQARLRRAKLRANACVEDIDYRAARGLDKPLLRSLAAESAWVERHENVFVCGPTGVGKSYLACALAHKACRDGYSAFYTRAAALFRDLALARADGSLRNFLQRLSKVDVLVVDDWAMTPLSESEARDFWEICEDRSQTRSLVLTSQLPVTIRKPASLRSDLADRLPENGDRFHRRMSDRFRENPQPAGRCRPDLCRLSRQPGCRLLFACCFQRSAKRRPGTDCQGFGQSSHRGDPSRPACARPYRKGSRTR